MAKVAELERALARGGHESATEGNREADDKGSSQAPADEAHLARLLPPPALQHGPVRWANAAAASLQGNSDSQLYTYSQSRGASLGASPLRGVSRPITYNSPSVQALGNILQGQTSL